MAGISDDDMSKVFEPNWTATTFAQHAKQRLLAIYWRNTVLELRELARERRRKSAVGDYYN